MLESNLPLIESDLKEIVNLFDGAENINIRHQFKKGENKFVNTIILDGKVYAFGTFVNNISDEIEENTGERNRGRDWCTTAFIVSNNT